MAKFLYMLLCVAMMFDPALAGIDGNSVDESNLSPNSNPPEPKLLTAPNVEPNWINFGEECTRSMMAQVQMEVDACYLYLAMGSYFLRDNVNRPGFAEFFLQAAREERQHAMKLLDYLTMRGKLTKGATDVIIPPVVEKHEWKNGVEALSDALQKESEVTDAIRAMIDVCEGYNTLTNFYHAVDYLTGEFLDEQLHGQRALAGQLATLKKMMQEHGTLGEFLFDKTLSGGMH